jgi:prepilin-type N-terminal cleavage/methylation domain-containing protein
MIIKPASSTTRPRAGFTIVEVMISMTIVSIVMGMCLSTFLFGLRTMYKDTQRLMTNASLRSFMAQISKETLDASYFYLFPYYTSLDGTVNLDTDYAALSYVDAADDDYDKWVGHGDCLVLITKTALHRTTDIKQIRIYYRVTVDQRTTATTNVNAEAAIRYYETADWGEGTVTTSNGHSDVTAELNLINLNANPSLTGSKLLNARSKGRAVPSPYTPYSSGDLYPIFSSESPSASASNGFISINVEFINGSTLNNLLSSSSFNYTISPRR